MTIQNVNFHSTTTLTGTSTGAGVVFPNSFNAYRLRVTNSGQVPVYLRLSATSEASTGDAPLEPGETFDEQVAWMNGFGLATASTSTGDLAKRVDVLAIG